MSWQLVTFALLAAAIGGGFWWYERSRPPARLVALVAALAALAIAGRLVFAPIPNVVATTDVALLTGYALGGAPGFAVGALTAPISNIWLGQGPWTAWEMAGWGLVGIAGAVAATICRRRLGRLGLATICALAGLCYGALLDLSVMVTYGGEQSLERYLALSARAIPFNIAHAAGNFAIAFAAGPALVRMISRYRTRLEFSWRPAGALPLAAVAAALVLGASIAVPAVARGADSAAWLARSQNEDGGFAATRGQPSSPAMTAWAMLGLEADGRNPRDVRHRGRSAVDYLRAEIHRVRSVTDLERTILALVGAGVNPREFAGRNLVNQLRRQRDRDGSVDDQVNMTAFYVLAMRAAGAIPAELKRPAAWLRKAQADDHGWGFQPRAPSDPDSTGAALQALAAAGGAGKAARSGAGYLRRAQHRSGGYALATSGVVNSQSTAWAVQGLIAAGAGGRPVEKALSYLDRLRANDGHYRYSSSSDQTPVWVTAQALLATNRSPFPLAAVPRAPATSGTGSQGGGQRSPDDAAGTGETAAGGGGGATPSPAAQDSEDKQFSFDGIGAIDLDQGNRGSHGSGEENGKDGTGARAGGRSPADKKAAADAGEAGAGAPATEPASTEATPASTSEPDDSAAAPWVAAGLGGLALVLVAGFFLYRNRLP